jgi:signal transduction histidine kinase
MSRETMERIFDPFFTTKFTGRGLGMAAILGIVRGHHGAIKIYSEPGRGSSFKILLPASQRPAERAPEAA